MKRTSPTKETSKFADRLRSALKEAGIRPSATVVANEFNLRYWGEGITSHAARNWLMGVSVPKQDKLLILCKWLKISPEGLLLAHRPLSRLIKILLKTKSISLTSNSSLNIYCLNASKNASFAR